ncbi:ATP-binding protein [Microvirga sp. W0021]|uniref:histidine kinase n=1 Tax=Hohaiivirga grylli TaxID=3133970 RepID=A0ABV0BFX8_9HYPH
MSDHAPSSRRADRHNQRWQYLLQGAGIALLIFLLWAGLKGDIDFRLALAAIILLGALLGASFLQDIQAHQRNKAEQESTGSSLPLADTLLANIPDPIILIDRRMIVYETNAAAQELLPTLKKGLPLSFSLRNPDVLAGIDLVLKNGTSIKVEHNEKSPTERAYELQISLLRGNEQWVLLFFRDLTSARRLEKMRVDFIANVSHELRTPLASVIGFIETIQGPARNDEASREKFLDVMLTQSRRMARLIDDLLSLSRVELHVHMAPDTPLDLESTVRQIISALAPRAKENGFKLNLITEGGPFMINGDHDEMLRVAENLIENAIKYGGDGGQIDITLRNHRAVEDKRAEVEFSVRDHGVGIAAKYLPRLTERFYRPDTEIGRRKGGTGLGLAIVKHIIIRHRGKLGIESDLGKGSLFTVRLPARLSDNQKT